MLTELLEENKRLRLAVALAKAQDQTRVVEAALKNVHRLKSDYEESLRDLGIAQAALNKLAAELAGVEMEFATQEKIPA